MSYGKTKVYNDGSHYIAIPQIKQSWKKRKNQSTQSIKEMEQKQTFEKIYNENKDKPKKEKIEKIKSELKESFNNEEQLKNFVNANLERKKRNLIEKRKRLYRKAYLQKWSYFCTFTYDEKKLSEDEFRKKLSESFKKLSYRKGWKYIGVWERSPTNKRLHFHGIFYTPTMIGKFIEQKDYSTKNHKMQITYQNSYFLERFGRNDFEEINPYTLAQSITYITKYIEKSGERIVYSKNLPTYFISDIMDEDIVCTIGQEDRKLLLFDNFKCWDEGVLIGEVSPEVIEQMKKSN